MNIIDAAKRYARANDMAFYSGFVKKMAETKLEFPAIWMEPGELAGKEEEDGETLTYKVKMHMLRLDRNYTQEEMERMWETMRGDALKLFEQMAQDETVAQVCKFNCVPSQSRLTNYGEISMAVSFEAGTAHAGGGTGDSGNSKCRGCINYEECVECVECAECMECTGCME